MNRYYEVTGTANGMPASITVMANDIVDAISRVGQFGLYPFSILSVRLVSQPGVVAA